MARAAAMNCDDIEPLLLDLLENELPADQRQIVERHLSGCGVCRGKADDLRHMLRDMSAARSLGGGAPGSNAMGSNEAARPSRLTRLGDFEILEEIGRGGMGVVYRAQQISLKRVVALKVLPPAFVHSDRSIVRFHKEAQAAARLHHTNIVPVYAQGYEDNHFFYAMELIVGNSLSAVLRSSPLKLRLSGDEDTAATRAWTPESVTRRLSADQRHDGEPTSISVSTTAPRSARRTRDFKRIARLIAEVADGLHHAHDAGIIHRDIKPQNLLLGDDDHLHITDFGLARLLDEPGVTMSFENVGTPAYMSPEQVSSERRPVDGRCDVFSLGVTLYELLTRQRPFVGSSVNQVIHAILHREPMPPRKIDASIPPDLETICLRALEKEPARRFPTAGEMARDLMRYAQDFPIASRRTGLLGKALRWVRRNPARATAVGVTALLLLLIPILGMQVSALANTKIRAAQQTLLNNYRDGERAIEELGWAAWFGGDRFIAERTRLFATIRPRSGNMPPETLAGLAKLVALRPDDADTRYLYAWALHWSQGGDAAVTDQIALAERNRDRTTHIGWFFRGQAELESLDPEGANAHFRDAINSASDIGAVFLQAQVHQARAINYIMYYLRNDEDYSVARDNIDSALRLKRNDPYYLYLSTYCHKLAAEIAREKGKVVEADERFARSLAAAQRSREIAPSSRDGYAAEAGIREALGEYERAIAAWMEHDSSQVRTSDEERLESATWAMRLLFWLGRYDEALAARDRILNNPAFKRSAGEFDCTMALHGVALMLSADRRASAEALSRQTVDFAVRHSNEIGAEERIIAALAIRLAGARPDERVLPPAANFELSESPRWETHWLRAMYQFERGDIDWSALMREADSFDATRAESNAAEADGAPRSAKPSGRSRIRRQARLAGAYFVRGVHELCANERDAALTSFRHAAELRDLENYCFLGRMFYEKLRLEPAWLKPAID
ncbi:MAG: protein kinase [Phycisphaerales bacterium]|nr:protein kinase [Phycisphaerales bacterium]